MLIRPYDAARDEGVVYALWQAALGHVWPLSRATFQHITVPVAVYRPGDHVVAQHNGVPVGFAATQTLQVPAEPIPRGELMVVLVHPAYQGQGLGRALLERALDVLRQCGVAEARLGGGGLSYFWPGVPANVPGAWAFFEACGWTVSERSFDLAMNLNGYRTPAWVGAGIRLPDVTVCTATPGEEQTLLAFEAEHFPAWLQFYRESVAGGRIADVILAHHPRHGILGTCGLMPPNRQMPRPWFPWERLLGSDTGGVACLGVAEAFRNNGIGLALAARATELLRDRGARHSYVGWTWLVDWYGRLGYHVWREYMMSRRQLSKALQSRISA